MTRAWSGWLPSDMSGETAEAVMLVREVVGNAQEDPDVTLGKDKQKNIV